MITAGSMTVTLDFVNTGPHQWRRIQLTLRLVGTSRGQIQSTPRPGVLILEQHIEPSYEIYLEVLCRRCVLAMALAPMGGLGAYVVRSPSYFTLLVFTQHGMKEDLTSKPCVTNLCVGL